MIFANIDEKDIQIIREFKKNKTIYIEVKAANKGCRCLNCGTYHTNVKEYKTKYINHSIYTNLSQPYSFRDIHMSRCYVMTNVK